MILADFQPGILFLILWGLLSWLTRKKKNPVNNTAKQVAETPESKQDIFSRLRRLQEHLSNEGEIFSIQPPSIRDEDNDINDIGISDIENSEAFESQSKYENIEIDPVVDAYINNPITKNKNWLQQTLYKKSELKKIILLKEIIGEPRALKPYTGDYSQT